jgi:hypothetical protein
VTVLPRAFQGFINFPLIVLLNKDFLLFLAEANNQGMICVLRAYQNPFGVTVASF